MSNKDQKTPSAGASGGGSGGAGTAAAGGTAAAVSTATAGTTGDAKKAPQSKLSPFPITRLKPSTKDIPGYHNMKGKNLNILLSARLGYKVSMKLSRPTINGQYCAVGTEDPDEKQHFIIINNLKTLTDTDNDPIVSWCQPSDHIRDLRWIQPNTLLVAAEKHIQIYNVASTTFELKCTMNGHADKIHTDSIRELAVSPYSVSNVVSCSFDKTLCHLDLTAQQKRCTRSYTLEEVIGSVRWSSWKGQSTVSCTLDNGKFLMYDIRDSREQPAFALNSGKLDLFTHEHYSENNLLFGYGDGDIKHIDIRAGTKNHIIETVRDPFVDCIGTIEYRAAADPRQNSFVVTGLTDFTVWRHNPSTTLDDSLQACVWSHMLTGANPGVNTTGFMTSAAYWTDTSIVVSNSSGFLEDFDQKFLI